MRLFSDCSVSCLYCCQTVCPFKSQFLLNPAHIISVPPLPTVQSRPIQIPPNWPSRHPCPVQCCPYCRDTRSAKHKTAIWLPTQPDTVHNHSMLLRTSQSQKECNCIFSASSLQFKTRHQTHPVLQLFVACFSFYFYCCSCLQPPVLSIHITKHTKVYVNSLPDNLS